jgi:hypothetical protein
MLHSHDDRHGEPDWGVVLCQCGTYRVKLGSVVLELDREDFLRLQELMNRAAEHFDTRAEVMPQTTAPQSVN